MLTRIRNAIMIQHETVTIPASKIKIELAKILSDEGGIDTINASPVTADILLDLTPGATSQIAGNTLTIALGTVIENAYLGDGDDLVYGNDADNLILGGRGDDTLYGGAGFDTALFFGAFENYTVFESTGGGVTVDFLGIVSGMIDDGMTEQVNFALAIRTTTFSFMSVTKGAPSYDELSNSFYI